MGRWSSPQAGTPRWGSGCPQAEHRCPSGSWLSGGGLRQGYGSGWWGQRGGDAGGAVTEDGGAGGECMRGDTGEVMLRVGVTAG